MASDKARRSYDNRQGYRAVVYQQGRVTLEADGNEAEEIRGAESRAELVDIVGPTGTPDDGFQIGVPSPVPAGWKNYDFAVAKGTLYLGGVRAVQAPATTYFGQAAGEWRDGPPAPGAPTRELVYLSLVDTEVSAVEDGALKEVALGGPDTAQRARYLQRVQRLSTDQDDCSSALDAAAKQWLTQGLKFDPATSSLGSLGKLRADFVPDPGTADPCQPVAQAGFLGDENQLIRVQVIAPGQLLWGYDNASFLYRATARDASTLILGSAPVDSFHRPRVGQRIEVLRAGVALPNGEFAAAPAGIAATLAVGYQTADQSIALLPPLLPPEYVADPHLFVRVWEQQLPFTADGTTPVVLGSTGVRVFVSGTAAVGDFWMIGVRPGAPTSLFPARLGTPQPPDGPLRFATALAVIDWSSPTAAKISDCRQPFDNLVELTRRKVGAGCCTISISPGDLGDKHTLQSFADALSATAGAGQHAVLCLKPGHYPLTAPLRLDARHAGLTIEGCSDGVVLEAAAGAEAAFADGLVVLTHANGITLRSLRFHLPLSPFARLGQKLAGLKLDVLARLNGPRLDNLFTSIGLRPVHSAQLRVKDCLFRYTVPPAGQFFGIGIYASSECWGFAVQGCRFLHEEDYLRRQLQGGLVGIALVGNVAITPASPKADLTSLGHLDGTMVRAVLDEATISGNRFAGLSVAIEIAAELGSVRIEDNVIRDCVTGIILEELRAASQVATRHGLDPASAKRAQVLVQALDNRLQLPSLIARTYPLPEGVNAAVLHQVVRTEAELARPIAEAARAEIDKAAERLRAAARRIGVLLDAKAAEAALAKATEAAPAKAAEPAPAAKTPTGPQAAAPAADTTLAPGVAKAPAAGATTDALSTPPPGDGGALALADALTTIERRFVEKQPLDTRLRCALRLADNDFATIVANGPSGMSLLVYSFDQAAPSAISLTGNQLRSRAQLATCALFVDRATVTGNLIANEGPNEPVSLILRAAAERDIVPVVVTGNLFIGRPELPPRHLPAPLDSWSVLNTVV